MANFWVIIISLLFSALFSGMEIAFVSSNKLRFELDKKDGNITSKIISFFYRHSDQYITTMLVGNNIALVIYSIQMANILTYPLDTHIHNDFLVLIIQTVIATIIVLFTGEFIPKTIFKTNPNLWLKVFAPLMYAVYIVLYPVTAFSTLLSRSTLKLFHKYDPARDTHTLDKSDLDYLVNETIENTEDDKDVGNDMKIFQNALDFSSVKLRDCARPRPEIIALPKENTTLDDLKNTFANTGFSKIVIYDDNIDNIIGYFHSNDLFKNPKDWHSCIRTMPIVPETMAANKLMDIFMHKKISIAVVVDEFGGTSGIVTLEDIMEEIFGEIEDEHDSYEYTATKLNDKEYILSGRFEIDAANQKFELNIPESDSYVTIAGFILSNYQTFPKLNDTIVIDNFTFKILQAHNNRIDMVKLTITDKE
ncbi:MAG: hemolysin family protein [Candidatus Aphodosoma sp.]